MTSSAHRPMPASARARTAWSWPHDGLASGSAPSASYSQGALALTYPLASGVDCEPHAAGLTLVQPGIPSSPQLQESEAWAGRFLQAVVEVLASDRPLTQLIRWTDQNVYADIASRRQRLVERGPRAPRSAARPHVATVHVCHPTDRTAEVSARVTMGGRSRAIAARLDLHRERWLCTAIQFG